MITLEHVYILTGLMFAAFACGRACDRVHPRRWRSAAFWGTYAVSFLAGSHLPDLANGILLAVLIVLGAGALARPDDAAPPRERLMAALRNGNRLFVPALTIPALVLLGSLCFKYLRVGTEPLIDPAHTTLIALAVAVLVALVLGYVLLRVPLSAPLTEGRRLMEAVGWAAVLPQTLASLGALFAAAGVGTVVGRLLTQAIPMTQGAVAVVTYTLGMAAVHRHHGKCVRRLPRHDRWHRPAAHRWPFRRRSGDHVRGGHAQRILRNTDDTDGSQLQHCAGGAARAAGP